MSISTKGLIFVIACCLAMPLWAQEEESQSLTKAEPTKAEESAPTPTPAGATESESRPLAATVMLLNDQAISGTLTSATMLPMRTSFGEASIPLSEVAGVKFAQEGNASTTVVLHNGDSITGATDMDQLEVQTEWGKAIVNGPHITSLLFARGLTWMSEDGLNGQRWKLVEESKSATAKAPTTTAQAPRPVTTGTPIRVGQPTFGRVVPR